MADERSCAGCDPEFATAASYAGHATACKALKARSAASRRRSAPRAPPPPTLPLFEVGPRPPKRPRTSSHAPSHPPPSRASAAPSLPLGPAPRRVPVVQAPPTAATAAKSRTTSPEQTPAMLAAVATLVRPRSSFLSLLLSRARRAHRADLVAHAARLYAALHRVSFDAPLGAAKPKKPRTKGKGKSSPIFSDSRYGAVYREVRTDYDKFGETNGGLKGVGEVRPSSSPLVSLPSPTPLSPHTQGRPRRGPGVRRRRRRRRRCRRPARAGALEGPLGRPRRLGWRGRGPGRCVSLLHPLPVDAPRWRRAHTLALSSSATQEPRGAFGASNSPSFPLSRSMRPRCRIS